MEKGFYFNDKVEFISGMQAGFTIKIYSMCVTTLIEFFKNQMIISTEEKVLNKAVIHHFLEDAANCDLSPRSSSTKPLEFPPQPHVPFDVRIPQMERPFKISQGAY